MKSEYDQQADTFLTANGLKMRITLSDSKTPTWEPHGHHYRVTLSRAPSASRYYGGTRRAAINDLFVASNNGGHCKAVQITDEGIQGVNIFTGEECWSFSGDCDFLKSGASRLTFDFFGSIADAKSGKALTPYSVLACISSDAYTPETFKDWCAEYGDSPDSLKALQTFRRCSAFAKRLRAFFTPSELEQLSEIR